MTALATARYASPYMERWTYHLFTLLSGQKAFKGGQAFLDPSIGKVRAGGTANADMLYIGTFYENIDATSGDKLVNINLGMEIEVRWWANQGDIAAADVGKIAYSKDDQTVTLAAAGASPVGRIWAVDSTNGVAVEKLPVFATGIGGGGAAGAGLVLALTAFASNNSDVAADPQHGATYDIPTTAAASTVTLPAVADEGTLLYFAADGVKNGHTVTYRDGDGNVALTTALTASKRHLVACLYVDGSWRANAYVSP